MPEAPKDLLVRAAEARDVDQIAAMINLPNYRFYTQRLPFSSTETVAAWVGDSGPDRYHLVAELEGQIVANASLSRFSGRRAHAGVIGLGVHDDHVGKGIGTALVATLVDLADNWLDLKRLELYVDTDNAPAIALYQRFGFETEGRHLAYVYRAGEYVDAFAMARLKADIIQE